MPLNWVDPEDQAAFRQWWAQYRERQRYNQEVKATVNPSSVPANSTSEQTFTVRGVPVDAIVTVTKPSHTTGLLLAQARVTGKNTVAITFVNVTGAAIDPPSEEYSFLVSE